MYLRNVFVNTRNKPKDTLTHIGWSKPSIYAISLFYLREIHHLDLHVELVIRAFSISYSDLKGNFDKSPQIMIKKSITDLILNIQFNLAVRMLSPRKKKYYKFKAPTQVCCAADNPSYR